MAQTLRLRAEQKKNEHRSCLTPTTAKELKDAGYNVVVESDPNRIFDDKEYEELGLEIVPQGSWVDSPTDDIIVGLKEFPEEDTFPLKHTHIQFAHVYKDQESGNWCWKDTLKRFKEGNGLLYDLEFLTDDNGVRISAFGFYAGFAGAAAGLLSWAKQQRGESQGALDYYQNEDKLLAEIKAELEKTSKPLPKVLVIGALGRCGSGAVQLLQKAGLPEENIVRWDMAETAKGGPFGEIIDSDIFINCVYLSKKIPPFVTPETLNDPNRRLATIIDVSSDATSPNNPIPITTQTTTFDAPFITIPTEQGPQLQHCNVDHLPSMLPREASESFSRGLLPSLKLLNERDTAPVWVRAQKLFEHHCGRF